MIKIIFWLYSVLISLCKTNSELAVENIALRQQLAIYKEKHKRPVINDVDRLFWVMLSQTWDRWKESLIFVQPETVIRWHRKGFKHYWKMKSRTGGTGRPGTDIEIRELIRKMAAENPTWGAPRIHGELLKLGFEISEKTVSRNMPKRKPDKDKIEKWKTFLRNHRSEIAAMDFFTIPTFTFQVLYGFFIIEHGSRRILHCNVTLHPTSDWVLQQLRDAFIPENMPRYMIFDRDSKFSEKVLALLKGFNISPVRISYRSPWQNGVAERWVGSCRRELLDHIIPLSEKHLRKLLRDYVEYYNRDRTHYGLEKETPIPRPVQMRSSSEAELISTSRLEGIHHYYHWKEVA